MDLGADTGIVGRQGTIGQAGPELAHIAVETLGSSRIDAIVLGLDIGQVRAKDGLTAEIAAIVNPQRAGDRRGIDQPLERGLAPGQDEIDALAIVQLRDLIGGKALDLGRSIRCAQTRAGDQITAGQVRCL